MGIFINPNILYINRKLVKQRFQKMHFEMLYIKPLSQDLILIIITLKQRSKGNTCSPLSLVFVFSILAEPVFSFGLCL